MSCTTCQRQERCCDGQRPICQTCRAFGEQFCSWLTTQDDVLPNGGAKTQWNNSEDVIDRIRSVLSPRHHLYRSFFQSQSTTPLLRFDHGLRRLLELGIARPTSHEQDEAQLGIVALLMETPGASNVMSLGHYNEATAAIARSIDAAPADHLSDSLAVSMILLDYYDRYRSDEDGYNRIHISNYQRILQSPSTAFKGSLNAHRTTIETCIYQTARDSLFSLQAMSPVLSLTYLDEIISRFSIPAAQQNITARSEYITMFGTSFFTLNTVYRISWLRNKIPLSADHLTEAQLTGYSLRLRTDSRDTSVYRHYSNNDPNGAHGLELLDNLYLCACHILLAKIVNPDLPRDALLIRSEVDKATLALSMFDLETHYDAALWPLVILKLAAANTHAESLQRALEHFRIPELMRSSLSVLSFLNELARQEERGLITSSFDLLARPRSPLPEIRF